MRRLCVLQVDAMSLSSLEERLITLVEHWYSETSAAELLALGAPALRRVLDAKEGKGTLQRQGADPRDYEDAMRQVILVLGKHALDAVLEEMRRRGWSNDRMVLSGLGCVADARIVEMLAGLYASKVPLDRQMAIEHMGAQRDPRATQTLIRALHDRSESVRLAAVKSLGETGDPNGIDALTAFAKRSAGKPWIATEARSVIAKLRRSRRAPRAG